MKHDNDMTTYHDVGPEAFADSAKTVISWRGENYYRLPSVLTRLIPLLRRLAAR